MNPALPRAALGPGAQAAGQGPRGALPERRGAAGRSAGGRSGAWRSHGQHPPLRAGAGRPGGQPLRHEPALRPRAGERPPAGGLRAGGRRRPAASCWWAAPAGVGKSALVHELRPRPRTCGRASSGASSPSCRATSPTGPSCEAFRGLVRRLLGETGPLEDTLAHPPAAGAGAQRPRRQRRHPRAGGAAGRGAPPLPPWARSSRRAAFTSPSGRCVRRPGRRPAPADAVPRRPAVGRLGLAAPAGGAGRAARASPTCCWWSPSGSSGRATWRAAGSKPWPESPAAVEAIDLRAARPGRPHRPDLRRPAGAGRADAAPGRAGAAQDRGQRLLRGPLPAPPAPLGAAGLRLEPQRLALGPARHRDSWPSPTTWSS